MPNSSNENFENGLQDILTPDDPQLTSPGSPEETDAKPAPQKPLYYTQSASRQFPPWLETLIRVIAAITAAALLILFGIQILGR